MKNDLERNEGSASLAQSVSNSVKSFISVDANSDIPCVRSFDNDGVDAWIDALWMAKGPRLPVLLDADQTADYSRFYKGMVTCVRSYIGSHCYKFPQAQVSTGPFYSDFVADVQEIIEGLVCEANTDSFRRWTYSGNSREISCASFLLARVIVDGRESNVLEQIVLDGAICRRITQKILPLNVANEIRDAHFFAAGRDFSKLPIHPLSKQIFFTEEGFGDVLILPLGSEALAAKMASLTYGRKSQLVPGSYFLRIGGTNPVNGGLFSSQINGSLKLLMAEPPVKCGEDFISTLNSRGVVYAYNSVTKNDVKSFAKQVTRERVITNIKQRIRETALYDWFAEILCFDFYAVDDAAAMGLIKPLRNESDIFQSIFFRDRSVRVSSYDIDKVAAQIYSDSLMPHAEMSLNTWINDSTIMNRVIDTIKEDLKCSL